ncbi:hypothetical protein GLA29479_612 [Lysobacter antibioticus]|uniref:CHAT domain-containing protein n=1 Tax=Lysobacter antibioticus TaxID=84531 RepID=UPI0007174B53|nr:CHAT domain-containing protein [Lysobacter antibioticus]ALN61497.1 hypothetical protein GLA29479_612 [Lysobacter antibioticus]
MATSIEGQVGPNSDEVTDSHEDGVSSDLQHAGSLNYWLITPEIGEQHTTFQGFSADLLMIRGFDELIHLMSILPASAYEVFASPEQLLRARRPVSPKRASIVNISLFLEHWPQLSDAPGIHVILGQPPQVRAAISTIRDENALFVCIDRVEGAINFHDHIGLPAQLLDDALALALLTRLPASLRERTNRAVLRGPFPQSDEPSRINGVTVANETLAESLGYVYRGQNGILGPDQIYVDAILHSAHRTRSLMGGHSNGLILYAPAMARHLYTFGTTIWNNLFREIPDRETRELIKNGLFRNPHYSGFSMPLRDGRPPKNPYDDPAAAALLSVRQHELRLTGAGVGALSANSMQPTLRLPNGVNFHGGILREIERHADRADPRGRALLQKNYLELARSMHKQIHPDILDDIHHHQGQITLVADAPLEWLRIDGLPLMIRHELSRIGMTPGNQMLSQCIEMGMKVLPEDALQEILVIRSFAEDDPIRMHLSRAIDICECNTVKVTFVDVASRAELIARLNEFSGAIAVFDCHGGHDGDDSHGWLHIGKEKIDVWQLAHVARVPPIVVLSACSTFALAGSHASVANGLLRSGAITVLGTFLPVNSQRSAAFVARLLLRLDQFLPAIRASGVKIITWRAFVSAFMRMAYATDLLYLFITEKQWLEHDRFARISVKANMDINTLHPRWYRRLLRRIGAAAGRPIEEVTAVIENESPLLETMYYCQIGRPETIGIELV